MARRRSTMIHALLLSSLSFFFNDTATTEIYTLSLHDALPIFIAVDDPAGARDHRLQPSHRIARKGGDCFRLEIGGQDRKSTRLNSSHPSISYAVFCLKKKNNTSSHA